jgi:hypothetical protein
MCHCKSNDVCFVLHNIFAQPLCWYCWHGISKMGCSSVALCSHRLSQKSVNIWGMGYMIETGGTWMHVGCKLSSRNFCFIRIILAMLNSSKRTHSNSHNCLKLGKWMRVSQIIRMRKMKIQFSKLFATIKISRWHHLHTRGNTHSTPSLTT